MFTGFVRQALRREVERGNALFEPGELLDSRALRRIAAWKWQTPYDLPDRGVLIPKLSHLAHAMQQARDDGGGSQVRIDYDDALELLDPATDESIVDAGEALAVLDETTILAAAMACGCSVRCRPPSLDPLSTEAPRTRRVAPKGALSDLSPEPYP